MFHREQAFLFFPEMFHREQAFLFFPEMFHVEQSIFLPLFRREGRSDKLLQNFTRFHRYLSMLPR